jgi:hypothetical protein
MAEPEAPSTSGEPQDPDDSQPSRAEIAQRAYELAQGDDAGSDVENWLRAERELRDRDR